MTTTDYLIAEATDADVPELVALVNGAYRGAGSRQGWTTEADLLGGQRTDADGLRELLETPGAAVLACREAASGALVGCVYVAPQADNMYLGMLTVRPDRQAAGLGKRLLAAGEARACRLGCRAVRMTVITVRAELLAWYVRHGYRQTGELLPFPADPRFGLPQQPLALEVLEKRLSSEGPRN